jgi:hypothetical protein
MGSKANHPSALGSLPRSHLPFQPPRGSPTSWALWLASYSDSVFSLVQLLAPEISLGSGEELGLEGQDV